MIEYQILTTPEEPLVHGDKYFMVGAFYDFYPTSESFITEPTFFRVIEATKVTKSDGSIVYEYDKNIKG